jgi:hypothetical protein
MSFHRYKRGSSQKKKDLMSKHKSHKSISYTSEYQQRFPTYSTRVRKSSARNNNIFREDKEAQIDNQYLTLDEKPKNQGMRKNLSQSLTYDNSHSHKHEEKLPDIQKNTIEYDNYNIHPMDDAKTPVSRTSKQ